MRITLKLFGDYRKYLPRGTEGSSIAVDLPAAARIQDILSMLDLPNDDQQMVLVNGVGSDQRQRLNEGDVVAIFESIAGGVFGA